MSTDRYYRCSSCDHMHHVAGSAPDDYVPVCFSPLKPDPCEGPMILAHTNVDPDVAAELNQSSE